MCTQRIKELPDIWGKVSQIKEKNGQFITRVDFNIPFSEIDAATGQRNH